jgi:hypothetical protein
MADASNIFEGHEDYKSVGLKNNLHGSIYQLKLLMLFLQNGSRSNFDFDLATEVKDAENLDDNFFHFKSENLADSNTNNDMFLMLQAKHNKQDPKKNITASDLFPKNENTKEKGDFSLYKYAKSFYNIKLKDKYKDKIIRIFICTNRSIDFETKKLKNYDNGIEHLKDINFDSLNTSVEDVCKKVLGKIPQKLYKFDESFYSDPTNLERFQAFAVEELVSSLVEKVKKEVRLEAKAPFQRYKVALLKEELIIKGNVFSINKHYVGNHEKQLKEILNQNPNIGDKTKIYQEKQDILHPNLLPPDYQKLIEICTHYLLDETIGEEDLKYFEDYKSYLVKENIIKIDKKKFKYKLNKEFFYREENNGYLKFLEIKLKKENIKNIFNQENEISASFGENDDNENENLPKTIPDTYIKEFFKSLVFVISLDEEKLDGIIKEGLSADLLSVDGDSVYSFYLEGMLNWFKTKKGSYLNKDYYSKFLKNVRVKINQITLRGLTKSYLAKFEKPKMNLEKELDAFFASEEQKKNILLTTASIVDLYDYLKERKHLEIEGSYIFINLEYYLSLKTDFDEMFMNDEKCKLFVIEWANKKDSHYDYLPECKGKKIIIINENV